MAAGLQETGDNSLELLLFYSSAGQSNGFVIQERVFARVFTALRSAADGRYFGHSALALRYAELRSFAAKISQTVENDREISPLQILDRFNAASINFV